MARLVFKAKTQPLSLSGAGAEVEADSLLRAASKRVSQAVDLHDVEFDLLDASGSVQATMRVEDDATEAQAEGRLLVCVFKVNQEASGLDSVARALLVMATCVRFGGVSLLEKDTNGEPWATMTWMRAAPVGVRAIHHPEGQT